MLYCWLSRTKTGGHMSRAIIIAALSGMFAATLAEAAPTGNDLLGLCESSPDFCLGYAAGVMAGMATGKLGVCLPTFALTPPQVQDVITKFLREHPEHRHEDAMALTAFAIHTAWPDACEGEVSR
jgi:hypothetical protein